MPDFSTEAGFLGLFIASFVSATVVPGGSEVALMAVIHAHPQRVAAAVVVATVGNTLGAMTSYLLGRMIPNRSQPRALTWLRRYGHGALLLSWLPVVGDALCVGAGWLRFNPYTSLLFIATGKLLRYVAVAGGWAWAEAALLPLLSR